MFKALVKSIRLYVYCAIAIAAAMLQGESYQWQSKFNARMMRWHFSDSLKTPIHIIYLDAQAAQTDRNSGEKLTALIKKLTKLGVHTIGVYIDLGTDLGAADSLLILLGKQDRIICGYAFSGDDTFPVDDAFSEFAAANTHGRQVSVYSFPYQIAADYLNCSVDSLPQKVRINYRLFPSSINVSTAAEILSKNDGGNSSNGIFLIGIKPTLKPTLIETSSPLLAIYTQIIDNLVQNSYLRLFPSMVFLLVILFVLITVIQFKFYRWKMIFLGSSVAAFIVLTIILWKFYIVFPFYLSLLFLLAVGISVGFESNYDKKQKLRGESARRSLLEIQFNEKVKAVADLEENYFNLREQYQQEIETVRRELETTISLDQDSLTKAYPDIICTKDSPMVKILTGLERIAKTEEPVLITGESGTGKERIARAIHDKSNCYAYPFVALNCGALNETLLESELFGHIKGAYTGAQHDKAGFFETADQGTIFLDEISETSLSFQAKLLRIVQEGHFYKVGSSKLQQVRVRIIAATNKDMLTAVEEGRFRQDLYFRLNVLPIHLPPLRERREDILPLLTHFLSDDSVRVSQDAYLTLQQYRWPGNIRELQNIATRMRVAGENKVITASWVREQLSLKSVDAPSMALDEHILQLYRKFNFSNNANTRIAEELGGLHRSTVTEYLRGMTYRFYVEADFDLEKTVRCFNPDADTQLDRRVKNRIQRYLKNVESRLEAIQENKYDPVRLDVFLTKLPKKYQPYLEQLARTYPKGQWKP